MQLYKCLEKNMQNLDLSLKFMNKQLIYKINQLIVNKYNSK